MNEYLNESIIENFTMTYYLLYVHTKYADKITTPNKF